MVLTDSPTSPLAPLGDIVIFVRSKPRLSSNSEASVLAIIDALCDAVAQRAKHAVDRATELTDFLLPWLDSASVAQTSGASAPTNSPAGPVVGRIVTPQHTAAANATANSPASAAAVVTAPNPAHPAMPRTVPVGQDRKDKAL